MGAADGTIEGGRMNTDDAILVAGVLLVTVAVFFVAMIEGRTFSDRCAETFIKGTPEHTECVKRMLSGALHADE